MAITNVVKVAEGYDKAEGDCGNITGLIASSIKKCSYRWIDNNAQIHNPTRLVILTQKVADVTAAHDFQAKQQKQWTVYIEYQAGSAKKALYNMVVLETELVHEDGQPQKVITTFGMIEAELNKILDKKDYT